MLDYLEFRSPRKATFKELLDEHSIGQRPIDPLSGHWDPTTGNWTYDYGDNTKIDYSFPRKTLARAIEQGLKEGTIERTEPTEKRKRGRRPAYQYQISPLGKAWLSTVPALRFKDAYFFGVEKKCKQGIQGLPGSKYEKIRFSLYPEDQKQMRRMSTENVKDLSIEDQEIIFRMSEENRNDPKSPWFVPGFAEAIKKDRNRRK